MLCTVQSMYIFHSIADWRPLPLMESWPNTTSAWAGWSRFDIPVDRCGGVHSLLICISSTLGSTCHYTVNHTVNLAVLTSSFEWLIQLHSLHISLLKVITVKYFTQGKCEFMNFIFVLLDKIKILTL